MPRNRIQAVLELLVQVMSIDLEAWVAQPPPPLHLEVRPHLLDRVELRSRCWEEHKSNAVLLGQVLRNLVVVGLMIVEYNYSATGVISKLGNDVTEEKVEALGVGLVRDVELHQWPVFADSPYDCA